MTSTIPDRVFQAALAGLLHDVGKFAQRAGIGASRIWDQQARQDYKYQHALLTGDFIQEYVPPVWKDTVKHLAANHHRPTNADEQLIRIADWLSSGERARSEDPGEDSRQVHPRQLRTIFTSIKKDGAGLADASRAYYPLAKLEVSRNAIFPGGAWKDDDVWLAYDRMWRDFCSEARQLKTAHLDSPNPDVYLESLLSLWQRYTWCIPAAYFKAIPDISLYDHSRMTSALAAILAATSLENSAFDSLLTAPHQFENSVALLVCGDLTGVQDFLYTISHQGATPQLRGRSFYLQMLTEAAARLVLRRLNLPPVSLIYNGGGNFYLLAHRTDGAELERISAEISSWLWQQHGSDLSLVIAAEPLRGMDFFEGRMAEKWQRLGEQTAAAKLRRVSTLGGIQASIFLPLGSGGSETGQCQVCGGEISPAPKSQPVASDAARKCAACKSYEELGDDLRRTTCIVLRQIPANLQTTETTCRAALAGLGMELELANSVPSDPHGQETWFILDDELMNAVQSKNQAAVVRKLLVNVTPLIYEQEIHELKETKAVEGRELPQGNDQNPPVKPFSAMEAQSRGVKRLGLLRMDVDDLGNLFSKGLGDLATLSRVASLSFTMSLFFEGWVHHIADRRNRIDATRAQQRLYSIYSGGDDLFFVGSWDEIIELARQVRKDLGDFSASHPAIHASAGVVLIGGKYPLAMAAMQAGDAERQAKALRWWDGDGNQYEKDAITFLGLSLPWTLFGLEDCPKTPLRNKIPETSHTLAHHLADLVERKITRRSLLRRLMQFHEQYAEAAQARRLEARDQTREGAPQVLYGPWNWQSVYLLYRSARQKSKEENEIDDLREEFFDIQGYEAMLQGLDWVGLAARWAELFVR